MKLTIALAEATPHSHAAMNVAASGIGVSMDVVSQLKISSDGSGSRLDWSAQVLNRKGLISAVSPTLIKAAADQVIRHAWTQVRKQLGE
jgi:carbon monoxide dehydrogenase subunit G